MTAFVICVGSSLLSKTMDVTQRQIQNHHTHMNPGDTVQIEASDFNPDIDD